MADPATLATPSGAHPADRAEEALATRLRVVVNRLHRRLRQQSLGGLSPAQASALGTLCQYDAPTLGELAAIEQVQPPTMTRMMTAMEESGLVARASDPDDRRVIRVRITAEGRRTLQRVRSSKTAFLARRIAGLDAADHAELGRLVALLERLAAEP